MKKELSDKLIKGFPNYFYKSNFYFEIGDGWFPILCYASWMIKQLNPSDFKFTRIKEKFGTLNICFDYGKCYGDTGYDEIYNIIQTVEKKSNNICENCGFEGRRVLVRKWLRTICENCEKEEEDIINMGLK